MHPGTASWRRRSFTALHGHSLGPPLPSDLPEAVKVKENGRLVVPSGVLAKRGFCHLPLSVARASSHVLAGADAAQRRRCNVQWHRVRVALLSGPMSVGVQIGRAAAVCRWSLELGIVCQGALYLRAARRAHPTGANGAMPRNGKCRYVCLAVSAWFLAQRLLGGSHCRRAPDAPHAREGFAGMWPQWAVCRPPALSAFFVCLLPHCAARR